LLEHQPPPGDRVALKPGASIATGPESELAELVRYVLGGELEPVAGGVPAQHRIIRNDPDPSGDISAGDGRGSPVERGAGLRRQSSRGSQEHQA
jgi:hypothetical protein